MRRNYSVRTLQLSEWGGKDYGGEAQTKASHLCLAASSFIATHERSQASSTHGVSTTVFVLWSEGGHMETLSVRWPGFEALLRPSTEESGCGFLDFVFSPSGCVLFPMEERREAKEVELNQIWCCPSWPRLLVLVPTFAAHI